MKVVFTNHTSFDLLKITRSMERSQLRILWFLSMIFMYINLGAQEVSISAAPEWVNLKDTLIESKVNKYEVQSGIYYTNLDYVSNLREKTLYTRTKTKIIHKSGIDAMSQINIEFDTSYQSIIFHALKIHRNTDILDRTNDVKFKVLNYEEELQSNIYSGVMRANAVLEDIRKEDIIEVSYSVVGTSPLYEGVLHEIQFLEDMHHIDHYTYTLVTPSDFQYIYQIKDKEHLSIDQYDGNGNTYLNISGYHISPVELEESMSLSSIPFNILEVSSFDNWKHVKDWASNLFIDEDSEELDDMYSSVVKQDENTLQNATHLLDYIQNDIRYTSINGGIASLVATEPSKVIQRHYGDCKDKSLLLIHVLKKLGVEKVYPALVNSSGGKALNKFLPGFSYFDHVIVKCEINKKTVWVDPSLYLQGGTILDRHSYDYGYALVLDDKSSKLEKMDVEEANSAVEIDEKFDFSDIKKEGKLVVLTTYRGRNADMLRNMYDQFSPKDMADMFKEAYSKIFLDVRTNSKLEIKDDYEKNIIIMKEDYIIGKPWKKIEDDRFDGMSFLYEPMNLYNYFTPTTCDAIQYPIDLDKNSSYKQKTNFKLPKDAIYRLNDIDTKNKAYLFSKKQKIVSVSETEIVYNFKIKADQIKPKDYYEICEDINRDCRNLLLNVVWLKNP